MFRKQKKIILELICGLLILSGNVFAYTNPVDLNYKKYTPLEGVADPSVIKYLGKYYLFATKEIGIDNYMHVWESENLVDWKCISTNIHPTKQYDHAWSPNLFYDNDGTFYMYQTADIPEPFRQVTRVMTADKPWGPFTEATGDLFPKYTLFSPAPFRDDNGDLYLILSDGSYKLGGDGPGLRYCKMENPLKPDDSSYTKMDDAYIKGDYPNDFYVEGHDGDPAWFMRGNSTWTEGGQVIKVYDDNGQPMYYLSYCGYHWLSIYYQCRAAIGNSIAELKDQPEEKLLNPIIENDKWDPKGDLDKQHISPGENHVFIGPDLESYWTVYHTRKPTSGYRKISLDRVLFDSDRHMYVDGPHFDSSVEITNPALPRFLDYFTSPVLDTNTWFIKNSKDKKVNWTIIDTDKHNRAVKCNAAGIDGLSYIYTHYPTGKDFTAEFNLKADNETVNGTYGAFCSFIDTPETPSYLVVELNKTSNSAVIREVVNAKEILNHSITLPKNFIFSKWHNIRIRRTGQKYLIYLDDRMIYEFEANNLSEGHIGYVSEGVNAEFGYIAFN